MRGTSLLARVHALGIQTLNSPRRRVRLRKRHHQMRRRVQQTAVDSEPIASQGARRRYLLTRPETTRRSTIAHDGRSAGTVQTAHSSPPRIYGCVQANEATETTPKMWDATLVRRLKRQNPADPGSQATSRAARHAPSAQSPANLPFTDLQGANSDSRRDNRRRRASTTYPGALSFCATI